MFHAKYLSSSSLGSLKEDFLSFYYMHIGKINDPLSFKVKVYGRWTAGRKAITRAHPVPL
jgi:hypothetical protein